MSSARASQATCSVIAGDAFKEIPKVDGHVRSGVPRRLEAGLQEVLRLVFPRLDPGGVFVAHNVVNKKSEMGDFLTAINSRSDAWTSIVSPSGEGMSLTYKHRR